jgi:DNA-binding Lrp family transcriptional regulator
LAYGVVREIVSYDEVDHNVLCALTQHSYGSYRELARLMGMPQTTLDYRLKRLRQSGVVVGLYHEIQPALIGMQSFLLLVSIKGISSEFRGEFLVFCESHPNIIVTVHSIGSWDFEVVVAISQAIHDRFSGSLNWLKILPLFSYLKVAEYPFQAFSTRTF